MNNTYFIKPDKNFQKRLLIFGIATIMVEILATIYSFLGLYEMVPITIPIFIAMLLILLFVNFLMLVLVGRNIDKVGVRSVIVFIIWLGLVVGFWIFAPIYYLISMNFDALQFKWVVFSFIWEVPLVGGVFMLLSLFLFRPMHRFLEGKSSSVDIANIYDRLKLFPVLVGVLLVVVVVFGYMVGAMQQKYFANMSVVEQWKNVANGLTISILAGVSISLLMDLYFNKIRSYVRKEHDVISQKITNFTSKIAITMMVIIITGIGMTTMLNFKSAQNLVRDMIVNRSLEEFENVISLNWPQMSPEEREHELNHMRRGERGKVFIADTSNINSLKLLDSNRKYITNNESGVVDDYQFDLKTIIFRTNPLTSEKIVSVIYLTDYYDKIMDTIGLIALGWIFIVLTAGLIVLFYKNSISRPLDAIRRSISPDKSSDNSSDFEITTGDEFEELSAAILGYKSALHQANADLETRVEEQTKELSKQLIDTEKKNAFLEDTKKAVFNILEDAQELQLELKQEKEGVEKKVEERTRELASEHAKLQASINSLPIGFAMTDNSHKVITMNGIARAILCPSSGNHAGITKDADNHLQCDLDEIEKKLKGVLDIEKAITQVATTGKPFETKDVLLDDLFLHISITPIVVIVDKKLQVLGSVVLVENITEEKILERAKDEFFSIASHELRTPLTAIRGNTSLIKEYFASELKNKELVEMIDDIHTSSTRLISVVNDFLNTSRLDQKRMVFKKEKFAVTTAITEALKETEGVVTEKGLYAKLEKPKKDFIALGDVDKLKEVLINIIGNAVKFTKKGGIDIVVSEKNSFVTISVHDMGSGIAKAQQSLLFRKFQQAESNPLTRDTTQGTGLGLYISKLMMEGMGGQIELVSSEVNKGTTFSVTLPTEGKTDKKSKS